MPQEKMLLLFFLGAALSDSNMLSVVPSSQQNKAFSLNISIMSHNKKINGSNLHDVKSTTISVWIVCKNTMN